MNKVGSYTPGTIFIARTGTEPCRDSKMLRHCARRLAAHTLARQAAAAVQDAWVPCCGAVPPVSGREDDSGAIELRAVTPPWRLPCRGFATQAAEQPVDKTEEVLRRRVSQADMVLQV